MSLKIGVAVVHEGALVSASALGRDWVGEGCVNMAFSIMRIDSISLSTLKPLASVRQMRRLRCSRLFLALSSLRCVPSPTIVSGTNSL
jgi:hypothetical protein